MTDLPIKSTMPTAENVTQRDKLGRPRIISRQLFGEHHEIIIEHQADEYRLRITHNGKLILTK